MVGNWTSLNPVFNAVADEQGLEPGSDLWLKGGGASYSGQTGGQWNYGWLFNSRLSADYCRQVIANYGHRRIFYDNAPLRNGGYKSGGRPIGWTPEEPGDIASGDAVYMTEAGLEFVSGPDVLHFHLGPLLTVADSAGGRVRAQGRDRDAAVVAKAMLRYYMSCLAGQVRASPGFLWGDRGRSCIIKATVACAMRGLVAQSDADVLWDYIRNVALPHAEVAPGISLNTKDNGLPLPNVQTSNGLFWLLPALYDLARLDSVVKVRAEAVVRRWCYWLVDLDAIVPDLALDIAAFAATPEFVAGKDGKPVDSLAGLLTKEQILDDKNNSASQWGFRAGMIAEAVLGESAKPLADKLRAKWLPKAGDTRVKVWLVGSDGKYVA